MTTNSTNHSSPTTTSTTDVLLPHPLNHVNHNHTDPSKSLKRTRSQSPTSDSNNKKTRKKRNTTDIDQSLGRHLSADKLHVYPWPTDEPHADLHVLQEQICDYLSLKSFKRKYPDIYRRIVDLHEREYLKSQNVVTESQCDLGLTALKLDEVLELMSVDYPEKCHQFNDVWQQKRRTLILTNNNNNNNHKTNNTLLSASISNQLADNTDKTRSTKLSNTIRGDLIRSAMEYNTQLQKERLQERKACFDLQTMQIHLPANRQFRLPKHLTQIGSYPLALVPGQYQDSYRKYQSEELKYMPINTAVYYYPKPISLVQPNRFSQQTTADDDDEETPHANGLVNGSKTSSSQLMICHMCKTTHDNNQDEFIQCTNCLNRYHPICIDMNSDMLNIIKTYSWQCIDCKSCAKCSKTHDEANMMFCDRCDRGYHSYCAGLETIPDGSWQCSLCDPPVSSAKSRRTRSVQSPSTTPRLSSRRQRDSTASDLQTNANSSSMNLVLTRQ